VYSTGKGSRCPRCGWPEHDCRCAARLDEPVPEKPVVALRIEKAGRGGKTVTVVDGLPRNAAFVKGLVGELKRACGTGARRRRTTSSFRAITGRRCGRCSPARAGR